MDENGSYKSIPVEEFGLFTFMLVTNMMGPPLYVFLLTSFVKINAFKRFTAIRLTTVFLPAK